MNAVAVELRDVVIQDVKVSDDALTVELFDGRTLSVPLAWYPRLWHATRQERKNWRLIGNGVGIHWPEVDEDVSAEGLILGKPSNESQASLDRWLSQRPSNSDMQDA